MEDTEKSMLALDVAETSASGMIVRFGFYVLHENK